MAKSKKRRSPTKISNAVKLDEFRKAEAAKVTKQKAEIAKQKAKEKIEAKAKNTAALVALKPVAKEINVRLEKATTADNKAQDHRLAAALLLADAKQACATDAINFKKWAEANLSQSYETIRKLVTIGTSENPALALENIRSGQKAYSQKSRDAAPRSAGRVNHVAPAASEATSFSRAVDAVGALDERSTQNLIEGVAAAQKMRIVPIAELEDLRKSKGKATTLSLDTLKDGFKTLKASDKMVFVNWAAASVGVAVVEPDFDAEKDQPEFLKRGVRK